MTLTFHVGGDDLPTLPEMERKERVEEGAHIEE